MCLLYIATLFVYKLFKILVQLVWIFYYFHPMLNGFSPFEKNPLRRQCNRRYWSELPKRFKAKSQRLDPSCPSFPVEVDFSFWSIKISSQIVRLLQSIRLSRCRYDIYTDGNDFKKQLPHEGGDMGLWLRATSDAVEQGVVRGTFLYFPFLKNSTLVLWFASQWVSHFVIWVFCFRGFGSAVRFYLRSGFLVDFAL